LMPGFTEFLVDTFAISNYSDAGQGPFMPGSIFRHGAVDNVAITTPPGTTKQGKDLCKIVS
jgi:hypothetical protein